MKRQEELNEAWCKYMGKCSTEIMQALAFALRWCDKHPNWISVEDELPEENRWVLTYNGTSINLLMLAGNGGWYDHSVVKHLNITHWMPPPAPPMEIRGNQRKISPNHQQVIGTADHIKIALDVIDKKGGEQ